MFDKIIRNSSPNFVLSMTSFLFSKQFPNSLLFAQFCVWLIIPCILHLPILFVIFGPFGDKKLFVSICPPLDFVVKCSRLITRPFPLCSTPHSLLAAPSTRLFLLLIPTAFLGLSRSESLRDNIFIIIFRLTGIY